MTSFFISEEFILFPLVPLPFFFFFIYLHSTKGYPKLTTILLHTISTHSSSPIFSFFLFSFSFSFFFFSFSFLAFFYYFSFFL